MNLKILFNTGLSIDFLFFFNVISFYFVGKSLFIPQSIIKKFLFILKNFNIFAFFALIWIFFFYSQMLNHVSCHIARILFFCYLISYNIFQKMFFNAMSTFRFVLTCFPEMFILLTTITLFYDNHFHDSHAFFLFIFINQIFTNQFVNRFHTFELQTKRYFASVSLYYRFRS